ncbi:MAG: hypothetical protein LAT68_14315 [Cyclobacteriaceae bacterium]|nr:hypothetical protein [Cyclobacteriaceae bacterium]
MEWFKHDASSTQDAKIKKLLMRSEKIAGSGAVGYAIYFHCLELIAGDLSVHNVNFQLEHDSEIIADNLRIRGTSEKSGQQIVEQIMRYIVEIGLFECSQDRIYCHKLIKRLDTSMTSNTKLRNVIKEARERHDAVMIESGRVMQDEIRIDKNRLDETHTHTTRDGDEVPCNATRYQRLVDTYGTATTHDYIERAVRYAVAKKGSLKHYKDYAAAAEDYMRRDGVKPVDKSGIVDDAALARMRTPE